MRRSLAAFAVALVFAAPAVRADEPELRVLAGALEDELRGTTLDDETRAEVTALLARSLELVRRSGGLSRPASECVELATPIYEKVFQPTTALERSLSLCRGSVDADLLRVAYAVHARTLQPTTALERAVTFARREDLAGKAPLLAFASDRLQGVFQPLDALQRAAKLAAEVPRDAGACVERAYGTYAKQFQPTTALDRAFDACR